MPEPFPAVISDVTCGSKAFALLRRTASDQSTHERHAVSFSQSLASTFTVRILPLAPLTHHGVLPRRPGLARQSRLVNLERVGGDESDVGWDTVAHGEVDQVAGEQGVREGFEGLTIAE